jgi:hypothetical protein
MVINPRKPTTTEGIPVKISISGCMILTSHCGAASVKNTAVPIAKGTTMIIAHTVVTTEPRMSPPAPYEGDPPDISPVGSQNVPKKKPLTVAP